MEECEVTLYFNIMYMFIHHNTLSPKPLRWKLYFFIILDQRFPPYFHQENLRE